MFQSPNMHGLNTGVSVDLVPGDPMRLAQTNFQDSHAHGISIAPTTLQGAAQIHPPTAPNHNSPNHVPSNPTVIPGMNQGPLTASTAISPSYTQHL